MAKLIHISKGIAKEKGIPVWFVATTLKETGKAVYLYGHGTTETKAMGICCSCGRVLSHPVSILLGIGPECGKHFHDWNAVGGYTEENIERLKQAVRDITIDTWIPKACILEIQETEDTVNVPETHSMINNKTSEEINREAKLVYSVQGNQRIKITFPFDHGDLMRVKTLSGRKWHPEPKFWSTPLTLENVERLKEWGFALDNGLKEYLEEKKTSVEDMKNIEIPGLKGTLMPFQKKGVAFLEQKNGRAIVGDEMGLGKTVQCLAWLQLHPEKRPAIIVSPASAKGVWKNHIQTWMSTNDKVVVLSGTDVGKIEGSPDIVIVNYDILPNKFTTKKEWDGKAGKMKKASIENEYTGWVDYIRDLQPQVVIADECHYFKNNNALRTKAIKKLVRDVPHFLPTSGTYFVNRPIEGFNALNLVDPTLFPSWFKFGMKFCNGTHNGFGWDFSGSSNEEELHKLLKSVMIRRTKDQVLPELPDKIRTIVPLELTNHKEYQSAEKDFILWLTEEKGKEASERAKNAEALTKIGALKQLAVKGKMGQVLDWIRDFLESDGKLVVFATYKATIDQIMGQFGDVAVKIDGSIPTEKRAEIAEQFQSNPNIRLFVGNIQAAGVAITLTAASSVAFVELPWTPGELTQAEDRCHRIGQKNAVNVYYLISENTIEEKIATLLDSKREVLESVMDGRKPEENTLFRELMKHYKEGE